MTHADPHHYHDSQCHVYRTVKHQVVLKARCLRPHMNNSSQLDNLLKINSDEIIEHRVIVE